MNCPIGLECLAYLCPNLGYCNDLAAPWPLPYQIWQVDYYYDLGALVVSIPSPTNWDEVPNDDHALTEADRYDIWIDYIRGELKEAGWDSPVELPYYWDEHFKCLIVTLPLILARGTSKYPDEGFAPAVKLDNWRANWEPCRTQLQISWQEERKPPERDKWGFYLPNGVPGLAWKWQEDDDN